MTRVLDIQMVGSYSTICHVSLPDINILVARFVQQGCAYARSNTADP